MGSHIEINDTLKLTRERGLPDVVELGATYQFTIPGRRLYHLQPVRVFLVREIETKWEFVGHALISELTIDARTDETRGTYQVKTLYPPEYAREVTRRESPPGKAWLGAEG